MDLSKAALQKNINPDAFYVDDSCNNQKNHENQRHKCDIGEGNGQDLSNLKYNQFDQHLMINKHDTKPIFNADNSSQENDLGILGKSLQYSCDDKSIKLQNSNSKTGQPTTLEIEIQNTLESCSNFYDKNVITNQLSDNAGLTDGLSNKNTENFVHNKNQIELEDEEETIEKIAEMIETSSKAPKNSPNSRKRLQVLMRRNYCEQEYTSNVNIDTKVNSLPEDEDDINYKKNKYDNNFHNSTKVINNISNAEKNEITTNISNKTRFEEIEDKLEEMFAGIEDEKLENVIIDNKSMSKRNSEDLIDNYNKVNCNDTSKETHINVFVNDGLKYDNPILLQTKAAKKSTNSISINEITSPVLNQNNQIISSSTAVYLKTMHRRDSINMEITNEEINEVNCNKNTISNKEKIIPSQPLNSEPNKVAKKRTKYVRKSKIKNNRKKGSEFKNDNNKKIIKNRNNKKSIGKTDTINKSTIQQKIKHTLSSENENDERQLPAKDNETKHRSPFILVKHNGNIAVINTITADDSNEKWSRTKKTSNYVYERKTVKGCHSSTLSNRYDADTADSTWICVLCKIGPHQKRLGDLFGPYIITSDCDEYRSVKEFIEKKQIQHAIDASLSNFSNKLVKHIDEKSTSDIQQISRFNEESTTLNFTLGMSRISEICYEIWIHEECAIWAPNIFVVGSRLAGLEDVTWSSIRYECVYCLKPGALLCCLQRDCKATSHVPCAREFNWWLDESKFWAYCSTHILK